MAALTKIENDALLEKVKEFLGVTGTFNNGNLSMLIADVKYYLMDAGVHEVAVNSEAAIGVIARGVDDMWSLGSGTVNLSPYFKERAIQLAISYPSHREIKHKEEA